MNNAANAQIVKAGTELYFVSYENTVISAAVGEQITQANEANLNSN